ncbi:MAG: hypothetical protein ACQEQH_03940 [Bacillota bacterium]
MKKINELSKFLNENFPDSLDDMRSSFHLLQEQLEEIDGKIADSMNKLMGNNEYDKAREYLQKSEELSGFVLKIENIIELVSNNEENEDDEKINENINEEEEIKEKKEEPVQEEKKEVSKANEVININYEQMKEKEKKEEKDDVLEDKIAHYLSNDLKNREPLAFYIHDEGSKVENWAEMLVETCKILKERDENTFLSFIKDGDFKGMIRSYFSFSKEHIKKPVSIELKNRKLYIETDLSDNVINKLIQKLVNTYNIGEENCRIYLKETNTG